MKEIKCTGVCETCEISKYYPGDDFEGPFYTCDPIKVKSVKIIPPLPATKEDICHIDAHTVGI